MARTWAIAGTLSFGGGTLNTNGLVAVDGDNDILYTFTGDSSPNIYSWDGATETDLGEFSGGTATAAGKGLCLFKGNLYFLWFDPSQATNDRQRIYKYDGTANWNVVYNHTDGSTNGSVLKLACDSDRIVAQVVDTKRRMVASVNGDDWSLQSITGLNPTETDEVALFGDEHQTGYTEILGFSVNLSQVIVHSSGDTWAALGGAPGYTFGIGGYVDNDFWGPDGNAGTAYLLARTTDFIAYTDHSAFINDGFYSKFVASIAPGAEMIRYGNDNQAWTYSSGDNTFVTDGTVAAADQIKSFFSLGGTIYCICDGNEVYAGGPIVTAGGPIRALGMAADFASLYVTGIKSTMLSLVTIDLATLAASGTATFGTANYTEPDTFTRGIYPALTDNYLYIYGRDGNDVQIWYRENDVWGEAGPGTATWAADKFCVALLADPLNPNDLISVFHDNDVYRTQVGLLSWNKQGDAAGGLRGGVRHPTQPERVYLAGTAAGELYYSPNLGVSYSSIGGTAIAGTINAIEVSI